MQNYVTHTSPTKKGLYNSKQHSMPVDDEMIETFTTSKEKSKVNKYYHDTHKMEDYTTEKKYVSEKGIPKLLN
jgi:hypothetical protein